MLSRFALRRRTCFLLLVAFNFKCPSVHSCFIYSKVKQTLPDVVAATTDYHHHHSTHPQSPQKHRLKEFEELEAENERLKAIFDLHSISFNEHSSSKSRRSSEPEPGGRNCVTGALPGEQSSQQTKRCSMSSEGSGSTKYEDVRVKVSPHIKKLKIWVKVLTTTIESLRSTHSY